MLIRPRRSYERRTMFFRNAHGTLIIAGRLVFATGIYAHAYR